MENIRIVKYRNIEVVWTPELAGGGMYSGQQYVPVIRKLFGRVGRIHEFCAGPAYIGFSLLAEGLCDSLCLSDINPAAIEVMQETVRRNNLANKVSIYLSDGLKQIPASELWDIAISNPPHFRSNVGREQITDDPDWMIHREFYRDVHKHLAYHGSVFMLENYLASTERDFLQMLEDGGLEFVNSFMYKPEVAEAFDPYYFVWSRRKHPEIIWAKTPPVTVQVPLSKGGDVRIKKWVKYNLEFINNLPNKVDVTLFNDDGKNLSKYVPIVSMEPNEKSTTVPIVFTEGRFTIVDTISNIPLGKLVVEP